DPAALVTADAERLRAVTRRAIRRTAPRFDRVREQVVAAMKLERLHDALMTRDALRAVVARTAGRVELHRFLAVVLRQGGPVRVAEPGVLRRERAARRVGLDRAAELCEVTVGAAPLLRAVAMACETRLHRRQMRARREVDLRQIAVAAAARGLGVLRVIEL